MGAFFIGYVGEISFRNNSIRYSNVFYFANVIFSYNFAWYSL
jgi:hypothetical protein